MGGGVTADSTPGGGGRENGGCAILEKGIKFEFTVAPELMEKLGTVWSLLSARHPRGLGFERLLEILTDEYLARHGPEGRIRRRKNRESKKNQDIQDDRSQKAVKPRQEQSPERDSQHRERYTEAMISGKTNK